MLNVTLRVATIAAGVCLAFASANADAATLFSENFGTLTDATPITTSNSAFTYARASAGANPILEAQNPSAFSGASALLSATTTSLTGVGVTSGSYTGFDVGTLAYSLRTPATITGTPAPVFFTAIGTGTTTFTNNSTFSSNDLTVGLQITGGQLQTRAGGAFANVGTALSPSTNYDFQIIFNNSASTVAYGASDSVATKTMDVYVNGSLFANDVAINGNVSASAFRFYTVNNAAGNAFELDNVKLDNVAVPEPASLGFLAIGGLLALRRRRA